MKFLRDGRILLALACALLSVNTAFGMGTNSGRMTLLVAPARHNLMQVGFDILARENAVMVAYQGDAGSLKPTLHVWNGVEWLVITVDQYSSMSFLRTPPTQIVLIGDDTVLPTVLVDSAMAGQQGRVMQIPSQDTATVINSLGQVLKFGKSDWTWYAARYRLDLQDVNATVRERSWYDQPNTFRDDTTSPWIETPTPEPGTTAFEADSAVTVDSIEIRPTPTNDYAPTIEPMPDATDIPPAAEISGGRQGGTVVIDAPIK